ncbi:ribonuclease domain-containing protein [Deinococcus apachensis]|uniref:ribonuclease domain-containing protein n=1 Tax=Deinococcus apachensis TaxID=309886 RepID=UPI00039B21E1|nr:ribonuclease domain-containing protein [Deinococcus apachensis]
MRLRRFLSSVLCPALLLGVLTACDTPSSDNQAGQAQTRTSTTARATRDPQSGLPFIAAADLPPEGRRTLRLIRAGGPFPYRKDGSVFGNREGILPRRSSGGYREYTVQTPGEGDRGTRRIVCTAVTPPDAECYYSADHYTSFRRIHP